MPRRTRSALTWMALIALALQLLVQSGATSAADLAPPAPSLPDTSAGPSAPVIHTLTGAAPFLGDLRSLPSALQSRPSAQVAAAAPGATLNFDGLDSTIGAADLPPDANGDVGPAHYIQAINSAVGIYDKATGAALASFSLNSLMSQGQFGNLCDTANRDNPIVLYDTFEDRWVIADLAYQLDGSMHVISPPGAFVCFAVSRSGDPIAGGWNFYSINTAGGLGDDPRLGIWPDGIYLSVNMKTYSASRTFLNSRVYAFNKARMYAGVPTMQSVSFDVPTTDFMLLPSNARLQTGTPPPGTPNYFVSTWMYLNALTVYKFHVDWDVPSLSTFTGPDVPTAATNWPNANVPNAPASGGSSLDVLQIQAMQNQYSNIGGVESLWTTHTVRRANTSGSAAPRWYQVDVTGGNVASSLPQAATWDPDGTNEMYRFVPSLAVNRVGDLALGYSRSSASTKPAIAYAGRLATDPSNTFSQEEQILIQGTGAQVGSSRWGDYSSMTLDPDGCTFWYTNQYYAADGQDYRTRIGAFSFPSCAPLGGGTLRGTVTHNGDPVSGATVALGGRTATTDASGSYQFTDLPAGTYPTLTVSGPGLNSAIASSIVVTEGGTTTQDFALTSAPLSGCFTDTTQTDFLWGEVSDCDLSTTPDSVTLLDAITIDQQNTSLGVSGVVVNTTTWGGQTFTPAVTGRLVRAEINLFCSGCTGTPPDLIVSVRATSGGLPTGADLATATIPGFSSPAVAYYTANFASPATLNAGTQYALVVRPVANPSAGLYALTRSGDSATGSDVYPGGTRVSSTTSGATWSIPLTGGVSTDAGFRTYMQAGYPPSGEFTSSLKDANPAPGATPTWTTLSWNGTTPAGTAIRFQVAASNSPYGPFTFVGPDGTAATFFTTSGASLSQFNGYRYLKYRAYLSTTDSAVTPVLDDVTVCFENALDTSLAVAAASGTYGGTTTLSATLTASGSAVSGATIDFSLNGTYVGSAPTDASGVATLSDVSLAGIDANTYPGGVSASFAGNSSYGPSSNTNTLTVTPAPSTTTVSCPASVLYDGTAQTPCTAGFTTVDGLSGSLSVSYSDNIDPGTATASASYPGDANHLPSSDSVTFTIDLGPGPSVTIAPAADQPAVATTAPLRFTVTFDADVTGFDDQESDLLLGGTAPGALSAVVSGGPSVYTVSVSGMTGPGTVSVSVAAGAAVNALGVPSEASAPASVTFAPATPIVTGLTRLDPSPTSASSVRYLLTFSEPVTGVDAASLEISVDGLTGAAISGVVGSGTTYTVTVDTGSGSGTLQLTLRDDDRIRSVASGVALGGAGSGNGDFSGEIYTIDRSEPRYQVYLPLVVVAPPAPPLPDLAVAAIRVSGGAIEVDIVNQGSAPVTTPFWIDVSIAPRRAPLQVNEIWQLLGDAGLVWGVDAAALPLAPGEQLTLRVGDAFYRPELSAIPEVLALGTPVYVQVDSANAATEYGAVLETHERDGGPYNNIASVTVPAGGAALRVLEGQTSAPRLQGAAPMPARPVRAGAR